MCNRSQFLLLCVVYLAYLLWQNLKLFSFSVFSLDYECTWWRLFRKRVVWIKLDVYHFIKHIIGFFWKFSIFENYVYVLFRTICWLMVTDTYSLNNQLAPSSVTIKPCLLVTTMNHSVSHLRVFVSLNIFIRTINWRVFFNVTLFFLNRQKSIIE